MVNKNESKRNGSRVGFSRGGSRRGNYRFSRSGVRNVLILTLVTFLVFGLGKKILPWFNSGWDNLSQLSFALEAKDGEILILAVTPGKNMASLVILPRNLEIETPWFGRYQAKKLSLLARQEGEGSIFFRSLSFYLGIPVDRGIMGTKLVFDQNEVVLKQRLKKLFFPPRSIDQWFFWRKLNDRDIFWKITDLSDFSEKRSLPDGSFSVIVDRSIILGEVGEYFSDPSVKKENISIAVANVGQVSGLAQTVSDLIGSIGARVVEVSDKTTDIESDCLILLSKAELEETKTVNRLKSIFGCQIKLGQVNLGDVQILIKNVKM